MSLVVALTPGWDKLWNERKIPTLASTGTKGRGCGVETSHKRFLLFASVKEDKFSLNCSISTSEDCCSASVERSGKDN